MLTRSAGLREQLLQASAAIFRDDDLAFSFIHACTTGPAKHNASVEDPARPFVFTITPADGATQGLRFVGGLDVSFREDGQGDGDDGIATLAVLSWPDLKVGPSELTGCGAAGLTTLKARSLHLSRDQTLGSIRALVLVVPRGGRLPHARRRVSQQRTWCVQSLSIEHWLISNTLKICLKFCSLTEMGGSTLERPAPPSPSALRLGSPLSESVRGRLSSQQTLDHHA